MSTKLDYGQWAHGMSNSAQCEACDWESDENTDGTVIKRMRAHLRDNPRHTIIQWRVINRVVFVP